MSIHIIKCFLALQATVIIILGLQERFLAGPDDAVKDIWWREGHRSLLRFADVTLIFMVIWFFSSTNSPARRAWTPAEAVAISASIFGGALRLWAMHTLGRLFTFEITIRKEHKLIKHGPYAVLRHPSYTGLILGLAGLLWFIGGASRYPLTNLRAWWQWTIAAPIGLAIISKWRVHIACMLFFSTPSTRSLTESPMSVVLRVSNEEQVLAEHFGAEWTEYRSSRWGLLPFVW